MRTPDACDNREPSSLIQPAHFPAYNDNAKTINHILRKPNEKEDSYADGNYIQPPLPEITF